MDEAQLQVAVDQVWHQAQERGSDSGRSEIEAMMRKFLVFKEVGLPAMQLDNERTAERAAIWEVLAPHMGRGAKTWPKIEAALTNDDWERLREICGDRTVGEVLGLATPDESNDS